VDVRLLAQKHRIFQNSWCVRTEKGVEPVRIFFGQGEEVNFSRFSTDVLYGQPSISYYNQPILLHPILFLPKFKLKFLIIPVCCNTAKFLSLLFSLQQDNTITDPVARRKLAISLLGSKPLLYLDYDIDYAYKVSNNKSFLFG